MGADAKVFYFTSLVWLVFLAGWLQLSGADTQYHSWNIPAVDFPVSATTTSPILTLSGPGSSASSAGSPSRSAALESTISSSAIEVNMSPTFKLWSVTHIKSLTTLVGTIIGASFYQIMDQVHDLRDQAIDMQDHLHPHLQHFSEYLAACYRALCQGPKAIVYAIHLVKSINDLKNLIPIQIRDLILGFLVIFFLYHKFWKRSSKSKHFPSVVHVYNHVDNHVSSRSSSASISTFNTLLKSLETLLTKRGGATNEQYEETSPSVASQTLRYFIPTMSLEDRLAVVTAVGKAIDGKQFNFSILIDSLYRAALDAEPVLVFNMEKHESKLTSAHAVKEFILTHKIPVRHWMPKLDAVVQEFVAGKVVLTPRDLSMVLEQMKTSPYLVLVKEPRAFIETLLKFGCWRRMKKSCHEEILSWLDSEMDIPEFANYLLTHHQEKLFGF